MFYIDKLKNLEKALKCLAVTNQVVAGKLAFSDLKVYELYVYMNDSKVNLGDAMKENAPTAVAIVNKLLECEQAAKCYEEAAKVPYLPW